MTEHGASEHGASGRDARGRGRLALAEAGEAADLAAFLRRQLAWDRAAAARLTAGDPAADVAGTVAAVFTRPARFDVLAVRLARLREPAWLDLTVSAGELLEGIDEDDEAVGLPEPVTGPAWAGVLPPRGGWRPLAEVAHGEARAAASGAVAEFRDRRERLAEPERTREALDALAEEIWSRTLPGTRLPLRAVHAAQALGFLRSNAPATVLTSGAWLRFGTPLGSTAVRDAGVRGLSVTPL